MSKFLPPLRPTLAAAMAILICIGCAVPHHDTDLVVHHHNDANRPGDDDITEPPPTTNVPMRAHPRDPGALYVGASVRPLVEYGPIPGAGSEGFIPQLGAEASLSYAHRISTKSIDPAEPKGGVGLVAGATPFAFGDETGARGYAQADARVFPAWRLSAGWSFRPTAGVHGPQITFGLFELTHLRWNWDIGAGYAVTYGLSVPFYYLYTRSN